MEASLVDMTKFARSTQARAGWTAHRKMLFAAVMAAAVTASGGAYVAVADPLRTHGADHGAPAASGPALMVAVAPPADDVRAQGRASGTRASRDREIASSLAGTEIALSFGASAVRSGSTVVSNELLASSPLAGLHPALILFGGGLIGLGFLARGRKRRTASLPWQ